MRILRELDIDLARGQGWGGGRRERARQRESELHSSPQAGERPWVVLLITEKLKGNSDNLSMN